MPHHLLVVVLLAQFSISVVLCPGRRTHIHVHAFTHTPAKRVDGGTWQEEVPSKDVRVCVFAHIAYVSCVCLRVHGVVRRTAASGDGAVGNVMRARALDEAQQWRRAPALPEPVCRAPRTTVVVATANPRCRSPPDRDFPLLTVFFPPQVFSHISHVAAGTRTSSRSSGRHHYLPKKHHSTAPAATDAFAITSTVATAAARPRYRTTGRYNSKTV